MSAPENKTRIDRWQKPRFYVNVGYAVKVSGRWWVVTRVLAAGTFEIERKRFRSRITDTIRVRRQDIEDVRMEKHYRPVHFRQADGIFAPTDPATVKLRRQLERLLESVGPMRRYCQKLEKYIAHVELIVKGQTVYETKGQAIFRVSHRQKEEFA